NLFEGYPEETNAPYGISKRALLVHLQAARRQYGFNGVYLIPTNLYGERDHDEPETSHVIPARRGPGGWRGYRRGVGYGYRLA
ncbi:MAG: NAD-dependent epimerase/dehydratase family protein, partial [Planctomycetota bacterium]